jgi:phosphoenolpyruvate phosphomutase
MLSVRQNRMFRELLEKPDPIVMVGAHDGLGARLVEEAGFDAVWASGFEISASHAVPDASVLTMTEVLAAARVMNKAVRIPVVVDCDTGFGNAINAIRTVHCFEEAGLAGVCIEDNVFPKHCSFYPGVPRELADLKEHRLKVQAICEARENPDFVIIARTEALIAGRGLDEALHRARAYADEGADAILVHSSLSTSEEVEAFACRWNRPVPLICVPTTYDTVSVDQLASAGFKVIIFANHALRASVRAMQETLRTLRQARTASAVRPCIARLSEIYRLVHLDSHFAHERKYLPARVPVCDTE